MNKKETKTYCVKDYENRYCWTSIGVITRPNNELMQVLKCSQCYKRVLENIKEITEEK